MVQDRGATVPPHPPVRETLAGVPGGGVAERLRSLPARRPTACGAFLLALLVAVFLSTPLARVGSHHYLAADVTQNQSLTNLTAGHRSGNQLISDPVVEMVPWLLFNRTELAAGRVPLWNPYNACGVPHLANYQAGVFSPFSLPFYVLGLKAALLFAAALKLYLLGLFTYLFLLRLKLGQLPALLGAVAFQFSGNNVLLLSYPHSGVMVTLPAALYFVEMAFSRLESTPAGEPRRLLWPVVGVGMTLALGLISGHPEPFYFCVWLLVAYVLFRLIRLGVREPRLRWKPLVQLGAGLLAAGFLAALSGAWQVLPFFEYLGLSEMLTLRSHRQTPLEGGLWVMHLFPDFMGTPTSPHYTRWNFPPPNYEAANSVYIGGLVLLMGGLCLLFLLRDRRFLFFGLTALVWPFYAYDIGGALTLFSHIPSLDIAPVNRSQGMWHFALAVCAALLADAGLRGEVRKPRMLAAATAAAGSALLGAALWRTSIWGPKAYGALQFAPEMVAQIHGSQRFLAVTFAIGAGALAALWIVPSMRGRAGLVAALAGVVFLQCGFYLRDYNPVSADEHVYPLTPRIQALRQETRGRRLAVFGEDNLPPNTNLVYGLEMLANYDALGIHLFEQLHAELFAVQGNWRIASLSSERAMAMFGVRWALTHQDISSGGAQGARRLFQQAPADKSAEIVAGHALEQHFTAPEPGLCSVAVRMDDGERRNTCHLRVELVDVQRDEVVAVKAVSCGEGNPSLERDRLLLSFPAQPHSAGREYKLILSSPDGIPGNALRAWTSRLDRAAHPELAGIGALTQGGAPLEEVLMLELCDESDPFQPLARLGPHTLYRFGGTTGKAYAVGDAQLAGNLQEAWSQVLQPRLDPRRTVVLGPGAEGPAWNRRIVPGGAPSPVEVLEERPGYWRIRAPRSEPGHLVVIQCFFPGWRATVDGRELPLVQANYAFTAVPLEPGENLVELRYQPRSFRLGLWISVAAALTGLGMVAFLARKGEAPA